MSVVDGAPIIARITALAGVHGLTHLLLTSVSDGDLAHARELTEPACWRPWVDAALAHVRG